jgi:thiamine pyrophosphate-dependent acetolactate synthase large subunit-like protein
MMNGYDALQVLSGFVDDEDLVVAVSLGAAKHEWFSLKPGDGTMSVPLMGGALPFGIGVALARPNRRVVVIDTDGSMIFGAGSICTLASERPPNLTVLVLDNEMYESVGGHASVTRDCVDLARLAEAAGVVASATARDTGELSEVLSCMLTDDQVGFVVAKIEPRSGPLPPGLVKNSDAAEDKYRFLRHVERLEGIEIRPPVMTG